MAKKVSIIIPNYNREHLITETLDSIKHQDYPNWECIIVDDHSTDNSVDVIKSYIRNDQRFQLLIRPDDRAKGAGACRNEGFEESRGYYVQWFDSDDLMTPDHISTLVDAIEREQVDFAVGDSVNFIEPREVIGKPYNFDRKNVSIDPVGFGMQQIGWITDDFLGKKEILKGTRFNEKIKTDGDEYNFFTQLLHKNNQGVFVNEILTYRRIHNKALSGNKDMPQSALDKKISIIKFLTFLDIEKYGSRRLLCWFLSGYMQYSYKVALSGNSPFMAVKSFLKIRRHFGSLKASKFVLSLLSARLTGKGYFLLRQAIKY